MIIELHVLQNFVPANLNRDDTGSPKDCLFGGHNRARISSQCFKRAMRTEFRQAALLPADIMAKRTASAPEAIAKYLVPLGHSEADAQAAAVVALREMDIDFKKKDKGKEEEPEKTSYLIFFAPQELDRVARIIHEQWSTFHAIAATAAEDADSGGGRKRKDDTPSLPKAAVNDLKRVLDGMDGKRAADLALFGRMIADLPKGNVEAACQVAHALSTHRVETEFDFFTAVDDLQPEDESGAGMLGVVEFNSACFYRYANVDTTQLAQNLGGDATLMTQTVAAFVQAIVHAVPTGKQNSMAAHNPPSLVLAVARDRGQWTLANAFIKPVAQRHDVDLMTGSIKALDAYWGKLVGMYGSEGLRGQWVATLEDDVLATLHPDQVPSLAALVEKVMSAVGGQPR